MPDDSKSARPEDIVATRKTIKRRKPTIDVAQNQQPDSASKAQRDVEDHGEAVIDAEYVDLDEQSAGEAQTKEALNVREVLQEVDSVASRAIVWPKHRNTFGQWLALFAGVLIQPFFQTFQSTHEWTFDGLSGWILFALITSVLIFPAVYRNAFDTDKPVILQLAPIFAAGLGWQSLLTTVVKVAGAK